MIQKIKENVKAIGTFLSGIHLWGLAVFEDGHLGGPLEWWGLMGVVVGTFVVWASANSPGEQDLKALDEAIRRGPADGVRAGRID